jgi:hypothetical protein
VQSFLSYQGDVKVLEHSFRVPAKVHALANKIVSRIENRQPKTWTPREETGEIRYYNHFEQVDISHGEWLIMASTKYMLDDVYEWVQSQGLVFERQGHRSIAESIITAVVGWERLRKGQEITYDVLLAVYKTLPAAFVKRGFKSLKTAEPDQMYSMQDLKDKHGLLTDVIWHEALTKISEKNRDYLISVLKRGTKLTGRAPIKISTIHAAKGGEADNVLLITDLSPRFAKDYAKNADAINRLFYVGVTRTRQSLHLILPKNEQKGFRF